MINSVGMTGRLVFLLGVAMTFGLVVGAARAQSPQAEQLRNEVNAGTVRLLTTGVDGSHMAAELASVLNRDGELRLLPVMGAGGVQSVTDVLYLRGIDMAVIRYDILDLIRTRNTYTNIEKRIRYVSKLYNEEFHLLAHNSIRDMSDLSGKKVNFGDPGSGGFERAARIFDALGLAVVPTAYDSQQAIERVKTGEIAAMIHVGPKPSPFVRQVDGSDNVHLLPISQASTLQDIYLPSVLTHQEYPDLIPPGESRETIAVEAILAVYRWSAPNERSGRVAEFVGTFFDRLEEVQQPFRHPKWAEIAPLTDVPGWRRLQAARDWVTTKIAEQRRRDEEAIAAVTKPLRQQFETFLATIGQQQIAPAAGEPSGTDENLEELFTDFLRWRQKKSQ